MLPIAVEFSRAARLYEKTGLVVGTSLPSLIPSGFWTVEKRTTPTLTVTFNAGTGATFGISNVAPTKSFFQNAVHNAQAEALVTGDADL